MRELAVGVAIVVGSAVLLALLKALWEYVIVPFVLRPIATNLGDVIAERIHDRDQEFFTELLDARLTPIRRELQVNGGDSLKDLVVKLRAQVGDVRDQQRQTAGTAEEVEQQLNRFVEESRLDRKGIWQALSAHGIDRRSTDDDEDDT